MIVSDILLSNYNVFAIFYVVRYIIYFAGNNHFIQTEPDCKKFKRRNHSIYSNTV